MLTESQPLFDQDLQNLLSFTEYQAEPTIQSAISINYYYRDVLPDHRISPENVGHLLREFQTISAHDDMPFVYKFEARKLAIIFSGKPRFTLMLALFGPIQPEITVGRLQGIAKIVFDANQEDEIVFVDVSSKLSPDDTLIPFILQHVQTYHR